MRIGLSILSVESTIGSMDYAAFRERHELTQAEAAELVGVTTATWGHWETGIRRPSTDKAWEIIEMARKLGERYRLEDIFPRNHG